MNIKKVFYFFMHLSASVKEDELFSLANDLTYKMLLALFPLLIFTVSVIGFLQLDWTLLFYQMSMSMPEQIMGVFNTFLDEVVYSRNTGVLSTSLLVAIFSASSGFAAIIRGINKTYGYRDTRNFIYVRLLSVALMTMFTLALACMISLIIFGNIIRDYLIAQNSYNGILRFLFGFAGYCTSLSVIVLVLMIIYKTSCCKKIKMLSVLPGALSTIAIWVFASMAFNIYLNNFARFSRIYGSIASVFVLMIWLNILALAMLLGSEINAMLYNES